MTATPTATPEPIPEHLRVEGLFGDPRPTVPDRVVEIGPRPPPTFPDPPEGHTMLYDLERMEARDLGPGSTGSFSPDGRWMAWLQGDSPHEIGSLKVLDLKTGRVRDLGSALGRSYFDPDARHLVWVALREADQQTLRVLDLERDDVRDLGALAFIDQFVAPGQVRVARSSAGSGSSSVMWEIVDVETGSRSPSELDPRSGRSVLSPAGSYRLDFAWGELGDGRQRVVLRDLVSGTDVLAANVLWAEYIGERELLIASRWTGTSSNLFVLDIDTKVAQFVATVTTHSGALPAAASDQWVAWIERACEGTRATTRVYDRRSGSLVAYQDSPLLPSAFTVDGRLVAGLGKEVLVDLSTHRQVAVILEHLYELEWSPDFLHASYSETGRASGGYCDGVPA